MRLIKYMHNHARRFGLLLVLVTMLAAGIFTTTRTRAQERVCRDIVNITVCGNEFEQRDGEGFGLFGDLTLGPKGGDPVVQVGKSPAINDSVYLHRDPLEGKSDIVVGSIAFIKDTAKLPFVITTSYEPGDVKYFGELFVDTFFQKIYNPAAGESPTVPPELRNAPFFLEFIDFIPLHNFPRNDVEARNRVDFEFDLRAREFNARVPFEFVPFGGSKPQLVTARVKFAENRGMIAGNIDSFKIDIAGMSGRMSGIKLPDGRVLLNGEDDVAPQQGGGDKKQVDFEAELLEFSLEDNPGMPNLDSTNSSLVFSVRGVQFKDGRFSVRGGSVGLPDWSVGSAFKLSNQQIGLVSTESHTETTFVVSSTLSFPSGSVAGDARTFPMAIRLTAKEQANGQTTTAITGTLLSTARPTLDFGPLSISTPGKTELVFNQSEGFFGLQAQQVTLRWDGSLGGGSGVTAGLKLGVDKNKKLVFKLGAGGAIKLPDIRSKAFTLQLNGNLASANDVTTFTIGGTARLALPGNGGVAPGVTMFIRSGKNVRDVCSRFAPDCLKRFEYKLSSFELNVAGFGIGLTNAQGTVDGGFSVEKAKLELTIGTRSFGGSISGFKVAGDGDIDISGGSVELPPIQVGSFNLVGVKGSFAKKSGGYEFKGAGTIPLPGLDPSGGPGGKKISGEVIVRTKSDGTPNGFGVTIDFNTGSPGIPIGSTGMELVGLKGSFDVNAGTVKLSVGMRASTTLRFASFPVATVDGDATLQLNPFMLTANAKLSVLVFNVAEASLGIGHKQGFSGGSGFNVSFDVDLVLVKGGASLRVGQITMDDGEKKNVIAATGFWRVRIEKNEIAKFIPPVNINLASVEFEGGHFRVKGRDDTLGMMGRVRINMPLFVPDVKMSVFVDMRGPRVDVTDTDDYKLVGANEIRARAAQGIAGYSSRAMSATEARTFGIASTEPQQETIPIELDRRGMALFGISYPEGEPRLRLRLPNGMVLSEQDTDGQNSGFLRNTGTLTEEHQLAFILNDAQPGTYTLIVDDAPAAYDKVSYMFNSEPALDDVVAECGGAPIEGVTVQCNGAAGGSQVSVSWTGSDADSTDAKVRVGYLPVVEGSAPDMSALTVLAEELPLAAGEYTWELGEVPSGRYRLIVSAVDGKHPAVNVLADTLIVVDDKRAPAVPGGLKGEPMPGELLVTWTPNAEEDLAGYEIGFGVVTPGQADSPNRFIYSRDMGAKEIAIPAGNVLDARLWYLEDDQEVFVGIRAYDHSGNFTAWSPLMRAKPWALAPDAWTPAPEGTLPANGRVEVAFGSPLSLDPRQNVPAGLFQLKRGDGTLVAGNVTAITNGDADQVVGLRFTPAQPLKEGATYSAVVAGGASGITAADGRQMPTDYQWRFTATTAVAWSIHLPVLMR